MSSVDTSHFKNPYLHHVATPARNMKGKGAPRSTVFGVLGQTKMDPYARSLGGLVKDSKSAAPAPDIIRHPHLMTERGIVGPAAKTHVPGAHYSQVPYAGAMMTHVGKEMS